MRVRLLHVFNLVTREHMGDQVLQRWRGSGGNVRLSHLLMSFLYLAELRTTIRKFN